MVKMRIFKIKKGQPGKIDLLERTKILFIFSYWKKIGESDSHTNGYYDRTNNYVQGLSGSVILLNWLQKNTYNKTFKIQRHYTDYNGAFTSNEYWIGNQKIDVDNDKDAIRMGNLKVFS